MAERILNFDQICHSLPPRWVCFDSMNFMKTHYLIICIFGEKKMKKAQSLNLCHDLIKRICAVQKL